MKPAILSSCFSLLLLACGGDSSTIHSPNNGGQSGSSPNNSGQTGGSAGAASDGGLNSAGSASAGSSGQTGGNAGSQQPQEHRLRPGDPGVSFDKSAFDPAFPQMERWSKAGVDGGIPFIDQLTIVETVDGWDSKAINAAIDAASKNGGGAVLLKNGDYTIDASVNMRSNVSLIGESRGGVKCTITMNSGNAFYFADKVDHSGIYRLTIQGSWGKPTYDWNISDENKNNELPGNTNVSIMLKETTNCWIDGVDIINSADFPLRCNGFHNTFRDLNVDGVHNKQGGAHGYFFILSGDNLITQNKITHLRHISLQGDGVSYNVVYDNDFKQEVSFHSDDDGNNLIVENRITLPADMPNAEPDYRAIMGPWSSIHSKSKSDNFLYKNNLLQLNHGGSTPMADDKVYAGPIFDNSKGDQQEKNFPAMSIKPKSSTLYPIILD